MKNLQKAVMALNGSRLFMDIVTGLGYDRVGLVITGPKDHMFTAYHENGRIDRVASGLDDVDFITRIPGNVFERLTQPSELAWMDEHPLQAVKKYFRYIEMPFSIKARILQIFLKGLARRK